MVLRDLLDAHAAALACQPGELAGLLGSLAKPPKLVVTDSQVFSQVAAIVPPEVPLTSFPILMARRKGQLSLLIEGANALGGLTGESRVLVCEGCTHHRQCEDIGTVKMPAWIKAFCGAEPQFEFVSGKEFPDSLEGYDLVVHCGGGGACSTAGRWDTAWTRRGRAACLDGCGYGFGGCGFGFGAGVLASHFGDLRVRGAGRAYLGVQ